MSSIKYDTDFYGWAMEPATLLRQRRLVEADIENIAEEIESMGRSEKRELVNRLTVLIAHLLKWQHQPGLRGNRWRRTILEQRGHLEQIAIRWNRRRRSTSRESARKQKLERFHLGGNRSSRASRREPEPESLLPDVLKAAYKFAPLRPKKKRVCQRLHFPSISLCIRSDHG